ncbi:MAG TPA: hypothetical protein VNN79_04850 [Actinomycetota bacterium]|nr:hypothetical protein [Actinomycetota bacterium]
MRRRRIVAAAIVAGIVTAACSGGAGSSHSPASAGSGSPHGSTGPASSQSAPAPSPSTAPLPRGVTTMVGTDPYPFGVTVAFGRVWVSAHDAYSVDVIDPVTRQTVRTVGLKFQPGSVVSGGGSIWVQSRTDVSLVRIDPDTYATTTVRLGRSGDMACTIAFGHGLVWAAAGNAAGTGGTVFEIRPSDGTVAARVHVDGFPCSWASLGDHEWTAIDGGLVELTPGKATARVIPVGRLGGSMPWLAGAVDGRLIVTTPDDRFGTVVLRLRPSGTAESVLHRPNDQLLVLDVSHAGVWFASNGTDQVLVMDPDTMRIRGRGTLATGEVTPDPTMDPNELWLPDSADTAVVHVDPGSFLRTAA